MIAFLMIVEFLSWKASKEFYATAALTRAARNMHISPMKSLLWNIFELFSWSFLSIPNFQL